MIRRSLALLAVLFLVLTASACGGSEGSAKEFCALEDKFSNTEPDTEADLKESLAQASDQIEEAKDKAPDEIKDDVEVIADAYSEFTEETKDLDFASADDAAALEAAGEKLSSDEVEKAGENVEKWTADNCENGKEKEK